MNILHLHPGADTGGTSVGAQRVLEERGDTVRVFTRMPHPFGYPLATPWDDAAVDESIDWADVVILHNDPAAWVRISRGRMVPLIVHHHGSRFRRYSRQMYGDAASIGAMQVVSTVDLLLSVPRGGVAYWMPQAIDLEHMARVREDHYHPRECIRVTHAPTNRMIKGTGHLLRAVRQLGGLVELKVISRLPWEECLAKKSTGDIYWDQLNLGYGNNALEAWGMGMPVIAGASPEILDRMVSEWGNLPFLPTTPATLARDLRSMAESSDLRDEYAAVGMAHLRRFHGDDALYARAHDLYERAIGHVASEPAVA